MTMRIVQSILGHAEDKVDSDSFRYLFSTMFLAITGGQVVVVQPGYVQGLVEFAGFSDKQAGYITSAEMFGFLFTTLLLIYIAPRMNWRKLFVTFLFIVCIGNFASIGVQQFEPLAFLRFVVGAGAGGLVSLGFTAVGLSSKPDRNFGLTIVMALSYAAIVLLAMPTIYAAVGMKGIFILFGSFAAAGLFFVRQAPVSGEKQAPVESEVASISWRLKNMALAAIFFYFVAQGAVWSYLFLIGTAGGSSQQEVATGLSFAQFAGVAGGLTAAILGARIGRAIPLSIGILAGIAPLMFLFGTIGAFAYAIAVCVYNYAWNLAHPFLLGAMASFDRSGRLLIYTVASWKLGLAIGPALAAAIISEGDYSKVNWLGTAAFTVSLLLIMPAVFAQSRLAESTQDPHR
jgi:predicted MFS family arabinose efflux permease